MKLVAAAGLALVLLGSAGAEAGIFSGIFSSGNKDKLPKPIDHPIVRPKVQETHKAGKRAGRHPSEFVRPAWGAEWDHTLFTKKGHHAIPEYLRQTE